METSIGTTPVVKIASANTITEQRQEEKRKSSIQKFLLTGGSTVLLSYGSSLLLKSDRIKKYFSGNVMDATVKETAQGRKWASLFSDGLNKPSHAVLEGIRKAEELSPFRVMRTLQLSHLLTPFVAGKDVKLDISSDTIRSQERYFRSLLESRGEKSLSADNVKYGLRLEKGKLHAITSTGATGEVLAKEARLTMPHFALPKGSEEKELVYVNKILKQYSTLIGGGKSDSFGKLIGSEVAPFMVVAGKSKSQISYDLFRSYGRAVMEQGARVFDNPLEHIVELFPNLEGSSLRDTLKKYTKANLGTGGQYRQSLGSTLKLMSIKQAGLLGKIGMFKLANSVVSSLAPEDSAFSQGIFQGFTTSAVNTQLAFADVWSDNFQGYKEAQEYYAPGSTSVLAMAGAPLALGTAAATASYAKRLYDNTRHGIEVSEKAAEKSSNVLPEFIDRFLPDKLSGHKGTRMKKWGIRGALVGLALEAPFIPGALIGESSEKLTKQYTGEEDVAIRANRWWFTGSGKYGGDHIKYFDKSSYAKMMAETRNKSIYGDTETKNKLDPILHPFDYIRDPYRLEKLNAADRPYPVMGMDVSAGSFIGKFFEKTAGALIKPDIINTRLAEELSASPQGTVTTGQAMVTAAGIDEALDTGTFSLKTPVSRDDASLIAEGKLIAPEAATYQPELEAGSWSWEAFKDFIGLRGWLLGEAEEAMDVPDALEAPQLARSGEITNLGKRVKEANLGGLFGLTEPQRRFIPTSASLTRDRVNPLTNNMPSWMPGDNDDFWLNLQRGDPFSKIEHGASRLPGLGYESLNPVLEGVSPEQYPDIFKMKILSDVAMGSDSYYDVRNRIEKREREGGLTTYESGLLSTIRKQEYQRSQKKEFSEYKTEAELADASLLQKAATKYWEGGAHGLEKSLPSEFLTFFRPAGKLIHQRSAIEDYERTQLEGSDMAIWTKPIEHFVEPAAISARRLVDKDFISEGVKDEREINRYFDTLEYVKQRRVYKDAVSSGDSESARTARAAYESTTEGALASGLDNDKEILRSYMSLSKDEKAYFSAFSNAEGTEREKISSIVPTRVGKLYNTIWSRKDTMASAISAGDTIDHASQAVMKEVQAEEQDLRQANRSEYSKWQKSGANTGTFREHMADVNAEEYLMGSAGIPSKDFIGWDPRIDLDQVKLRALTIGNEDFFKYGFWKDDVKDLQRYVGIIEDEDVKSIGDRIKNGIREEIAVQDQIESSMYKEGYIPKRVRVGRDNSGVDINVERI